MIFLILYKKEAEAIMIYGPSALHWKKYNVSK